MNYPVWYLPTLGGGFLIALIAVTHVFVSHFAVGGGLFLIFAEKKGYKENDNGVLEYTKNHAKFFLLITMVFGSISGVGIWLIISLVQPAATSLLIHTFVFGWATEWVFFVIEIVAAFVYYYTFGKMDRKTHLKVGMVYFFAAWMSLFLIAGIIAFMLTPGNWVENPSFWTGFLNPSFIPSVFFRTFVSTMLAGSFGLLTASFVKDIDLKSKMSSFCGKWTLISLILALPTRLWYISTLPETAKSLALGKSPTIKIAFHYGFYAVVILMVIALLLAIIKPKFNYKPVAFIAFICSFVFMGAFEYTREGARRPFVINKVMYSNGVLVKNMEKLNKEGFLVNAKWVQTKEINESSILKAGEEIFINQCYACHTLHGFNNDLVIRTKSMSFNALKGYLKKIHKIRVFMPPFIGTEKEMEALAAFIVKDLHGKEIIFEKKKSVNKGKSLFEDNCSSCHEFDDINEYVKQLSIDKIKTMLPKLSSFNEDMPDFEGTDDEINTLANFLLSSNTEEENVDTSGFAIFENNCSSCHEQEDLMEMTKSWDVNEFLKTLPRLSKLSEDMPDFEGSKEEIKELAEFLIKLNGGVK